MADPGDRLTKALASRGLLLDNSPPGTAAASPAELFNGLRRQPGVSETAVLAAFAEAMDVEFRPDLTGVKVPEAFVEKVPVQFARRHSVVGLGEADGAFLVATALPLDLHSLDEVALLLDAGVTPVLAPASSISTLVDAAYADNDRIGGFVDSFIEQSSSESPAVCETPARPEDLLSTAEKAPVVQLVRQVLYDAVGARASDVHIQPREDDVLVRFRVDGILHDRLTFPKALQDSVTSRIKVMASMDIAERRMPQDGRTTMAIHDREIDLRVSCVPSCYGERTVLRLLDKGQRLLQLHEVGLSTEHLADVEAMIGLPHGLILVTGPTGSGKTTTLYAMLNRVNAAEKNVITVEDPIEYRLRGISQIQVSAQRGLTFASGLRSVLRQDPDVIMVGEIRDRETARMAVQSALTGHLVFSTLHTNDAAGAITRLLDIGIESYLVASALVGVLAQRLVRLVCPKCREAYSPDESILHRLGLNVASLQNGNAHRGRGCDGCMQTGYLGRTGLHEVLVVGDQVRGLVSSRQDSAAIRAAAIRAGLRTLRMDGARKVADGVTTPDEVLRATQMDAS